MSAGAAPSLPSRFGQRLAELGVSPGDRMIVAVSGGRDSVVLLHLLRFTGPVDPDRLLVAHFDHRMRPGSERDADWVRGLARAWRLEYRRGTAESVPASEAEARTLRYDYLERVRESWGALWVLTAHHADDQAETVLFRAVRGAGPRGLVGIRGRRAPGIARPLLPFWRAEIEAYAERVRLTHRADPSNLDETFARNRLRHDVLPVLEAGVAPGARSALVRLARVMEGVDESLAALAESALTGLVLDESDHEIVIDREGLLRLPEGARAEVLRAAAQRVGAMLDEVGTRLAIEVTSQVASGKAVDLGEGIRIGREFDAVRFARTRTPAPNRILRIDVPGDGSGTLCLEGRSWLARWSVTATTAARWNESFARDDLVFPLTLRAWRPGDRMRLPYGTKKLKKIFQEARLRRSDRSRHPLVVDAIGSVVWIPDVARAAGVRPEPHGPAFHLGFDDA